jgi:hypothetical protein
VESGRCSVTRRSTAPDLCEVVGRAKKHQDIVTFHRNTAKEVFWARVTDSTCSMESTAIFVENEQFTIRMS